VKLSSVVIAGTWALAFAAPPVLAQAQDKLGSPHDERFRLSGGVFAADTRTDLRLDPDAGPTGTEVSAEEDLALRDHSDSGDVEVEVRIRERHRVRFNYFRIDRTGTAQLDRQIQFGNDLYQVDDIVTSTLDMRNFGVNYSYEFLRIDRIALGASFGVNLVELSAEAVVPARGIREDESRAAPTPTFGAHALVRITRHIHAELRGEYLQVNVDNFDGTITNLHGAVVYRFNRNLGVGLGYGKLETDIESRKAGDTGRFRIDNSGGLLFLRVTF